MRLTTPNDMASMSANRIQAGATHEQNMEAAMHAISMPLQ